MTDAEAKAIIEKAEYWHYEFKLPWKTTVPGKPGWAERVEKRKKHFFGPLVELYGGSLKGKTVLDLGCCQGYWSFAASHAGAQAVLGIDSSKYFISEAAAVQTFMDLKNVSFRWGHLEEPWETFLEVPKNITLLLGCLYHTTDPIYVLRKAIANTTETIVIDGEVAANPNPAFYVRERTPGEPTTNRSNMGSEVRVVPTTSALIRFLEMGGFKKISVLEPSKEMPKDYHEKTTASIIASR